MLRSSFKRNALCDGYIDYPFDKSMIILETHLWAHLQASLQIRLTEAERSTLSVSGTFLRAGWIYRNLNIKKKAARAFISLLPECRREVRWYLNPANTPSVLT